MITGTPQIQTISGQYRLRVYRFVFCCVDFETLGRMCSTLRHNYLPVLHRLESFGDARSISQVVP